MNATLKRTAQLGLLARDLAAVRGRRAGPKRDEARRRLVDRLGLLHGLPQKIGQLLAFSEIEASDPAFTKLTENEPSLSEADAGAEVMRQLGGPLEKFFSAFSPCGIAASVGQVHRATLLDGREVAVKIQHPGIATTIEYDLRALGWLTAPVGDIRRGFDLKAYRAEIGESLRREVDYRSEASSLREFAELARTLLSPIALPLVVPDLSNEKLLVTTWLEGDTLARARHWSPRDRAALSTSMVELFFKGIFEWGFIHADPHPGNYRFLKVNGHATVGLLDFGCVKRIPAQLQAGIRGLMTDACSGKSDDRMIHERFIQLGFDPAILHKLSPKLSAISAVLSTPFNHAGKFDAAAWHLKERLGDILGEDRMTFRAAGSPEMIFILRAFQGLLHYLKILDAPVDWVEATASIKPSHSPSPLPLPRPAHPTAMLSETLHISVMEAGVDRVALTFGAGATDNLPDLVPHELRSRLQERAIDLVSIADLARRNNYAPGELFSLEDGQKLVRVWLQ
jgi:predicted unusual protein kinase regulating ubiquinone biosynthesis (AarF/ABC1/UbiB family)